MKLRSIAVQIVCALLTWGCASSPKFLPANSDIQQAFRYTELSEDGRSESLSDLIRKKDSDPKDVSPAAVVPRSAPIDINSTIYITVLPHKLATTSNGTFRNDPGLLEKKQRIRAALDSVGPVIDAQRDATKAYEGSDTKAFLQLRRAYGKKETELFTELQALWADETDPERVALEDAARDFGIYEGIRRFLNDRLRELDRGDEALQAQALDNSTMLRLEAWLESPRKEPVPIHLEGYDTLDRGRIQLRDRWGLNLTNDELATLQTQFDMTRQVAEAANAVLDKDKSLGQAVLDLAPKLSSELGEIVAESDKLGRKLNQDSLRIRMDRIRDTARSLESELLNNAQSLSAEERQNLRDWPDELKSRLVESTQAPVRIMASIEQLRTLRDDWRSVNATNLSLRIDSTSRFFRDIENLKFDDASAIADLFEQFFSDRNAEIGESVDAAIDAVEDSEPAKALIAEIESLHADIRNVHKISQRIQELLKPAKTMVAERPHVPEVRAVPVGKIQNTFIELKRTGRMDGDTVTVEATRYEVEEDEQRETDSVSASFEVHQIGWHAELSPAVVLAKPDKLVSNNDNFRFAPALAWLVQYAPSPADNGILASTSRALRPGFGIHAAFLNFDMADNESVQVGLGATVSFWENRLQVGGGYNLMSESNDDGRYYFYVGSDLIGILQTLGLTSP